MDTPTNHRPPHHRSRRAGRPLVVGSLLLASIAPLACGDDGADAASPAPSDVAADATTTTSPAGGPDTPIEVVATDFSFAGMPEALPAGTHVIELRNDGAEAHELLIFQNPEGLALEEIFALGPVEGSKRIAPAGIVQVPPGAPAATGEFVLTPGEWEVICFIPTTDGTSHYTHGMHQTLTVS